MLTNCTEQGKNRYIVLTLQIVFDNSTLIILTIIKKFNRKLCNMDDVCLLQLVFLYIQIVLEHTID